MRDYLKFKMTKEQEKIVGELDKVFSESEGKRNFIIKKAEGVGATSMILEYIFSRIQYRVPFNVLLVTKDEFPFRSLAVALNDVESQKVDWKKRIIWLMNGNTIKWKLEWEAQDKSEAATYELIFDDNEQERPEDYYRFCEYNQFLAPVGVAVLTDEIETANVYDPTRLTVLEMKKKIKKESRPVEIREISMEHADETIAESDEKGIKGTKEPFDLDYIGTLPDAVLEKLNKLTDFLNNWSGDNIGYTNLHRFVDKLNGYIKKMAEKSFSKDGDIEAKAKKHMQEIADELSGKDAGTTSANDDEMKTNAKESFEKLKDENKNTSTNRIEERRQQLHDEIENNAEARIMEATDEMYEKVIDEARKKLESEKTPDGTRKYSDCEVTSRISLLRKAQRDARKRQYKYHSSPKGTNECLADNDRPVRKNQFAVILPLFGDMRDYGFNVHSFFCDYKSKTINITLTETEKDTYFPELIQSWSEILNGENKMINISVKHINLFGKILYTEDFAKCSLDFVGADALATDDDKDRRIYLTYKYGKVAFYGEKPDIDKKLAASVALADGKNRNLSKLILNRNFERTQELCTKKGQEILDELVKTDNQISGKTYSKLKKESMCDNQ